MTAQDKRVLVIGGETTVGRAVAIGLAEAGADVAIVSLTADTKAEFAINSALNELWALGRKGLALAIDASDSEQVRTAVERAESELGPLDLVVLIQDLESPIAALAAALAPRDLAVVQSDSEPKAALRAVLDRI